MQHYYKAKKEKIIIPDVSGYKVLKCDFHIHTVFSDGSVWPTYRMGESHKYIDIKDKNAPYEIALPSAKKFVYVQER